MEEICAVSEEIERKAHVAIGMENLHKESEDNLMKIEEKLKSLSPLSSKCSIYRVPERIREINSKAYTPRVVSIGPFHHGKEHLQVMEEHKLRYLKSFLKRTKLGFKKCFEVGKKWEEEARHCYAETIKLNSDDFVEMMLVDGSFIVECLLRKNSRQLEDESDRIFDKPWMLKDVIVDMILLENQLPFFIVERLFDLVSRKEEMPPFLELVKGFFVGYSIMKKLPDRVSDPEIQHFVDFIRCSCLESSQKERLKDMETYCYPPTVLELYEAGIKFRTKTNCSFA